MTISITVAELYQRQITLVGEESFQKIRDAKLLVVGAGGLGCPALQYLAASGVGELGILDFDRVSASNLQRQILFNVADLNRLKVDAVQENLSGLAPFTKIKTYPVKLNPENANDIMKHYDLILDCTDNFTTKFLIHDIAFMLKKTLVQASVYQFEGQLNVFNFSSQDVPCLRCLWKEEPLDGCTGTCAEVGVMGPLLGVMGSLQAMEALKVIIGKPHLKNGETLFADLLYQDFQTRTFKQNPECQCCVKGEISFLEKTDIDLPSNLKDYVLLDVRTSEERATCEVLKRIEHLNILHMPMDQLESFKPEMEHKYLVLCAKGIRSQSATRILRRKHPMAYSLQGGVAKLDILLS